MAYDDIADRYDDFVRNRSLIHQVAIPAVVALCGAGSDVLDLGCGQGILARELAKQGRRVVGVDDSRELLRIARTVEEQAPLGVSYVEDDARMLASVGDSSFDGVAASLVLTDLDDLNAAFAAIRRVLRPGGWFTTATLHPCFASFRGGLVEPAPAGADLSPYFQEGRWVPADDSRTLSRIGWHHRTLSTVLNGLVCAGLAIEELAEPGDERPDAGGPVPSVLVVRARKSGDPSNGG